MVVKPFNLIIIHFQSICLRPTEAMVFLRRIEALQSRRKFLLWIRGLFLD